MSHLLTISDAVATHARVTPVRLGARDSKRQLTFAEWDSRASALAQGLLDLGLNKGIGLVFWPITVLSGWKSMSPWRGRGWWLYRLTSG